MRISARCDYACKALLELTLHWPKKEPLHIHTISERQAIPLRYLIQILIQLKKIGFVASIRGKDGGYILTKSPERITLGEVMRKISGSFLPMADSAKKKNSVFVGIWKEAEDAIGVVLDNATFEDIANKIKGRRKTIMYQI